MAGSRAATWIAFRAVVRRTFLPPNNINSVGTGARSPLSLDRAEPLHSRANHFSTSRCLRNTREPGSSTATNDEPDSSDRSVANNRNVKKPRPINPKKRSGVTANSLRKVAVEAQLSRRQLIKGSGKLQYIDPDVPTKDITAYCAAESYNLSLARQELIREGYKLDPLGTGLSEQVLHFQTPNYLARDDDTGVEKPQGNGDVFVFPSGCVVTWNVPDPLSRTIVTRFLPAAAGVSGHVDRLEAEDMEYVEDSTQETSKIIGDTILLGTKPLSSSAEDRDIVATASDAAAVESGEIDTVLTKIAFSSALARSTKLAVLENSLSAYFASTRSIPSTLSAGRPIRITRRGILRQTGELLQIRAQLNLYSELTDSLPDLFWDSRHELGLEGYYEMLGRSLDVGVRIKVLNEKMDYAGEIAAVLRERLSEKHSAMLEWMIIGLICIEVGFGVVHLVREKTEMNETRRVRELAERWLDGQLQNPET